MGHAHQGWLPSGGVISQRLIGSFLLLTFLMLGVSLLFLEDLRVSLRQVLTGSSSASGLRPTISGTVQPASALRCNRLSLPASYYNESQGPYNPAAIRHPVSREWLLLYTYDEVRDVPQRLSCRLLVCIGTLHTSASSNGVLLLCRYGSVSASMPKPESI